MGKIDAWIPKIPRLKNAKVSRFSYRDAAYTNDNIEGVENYDYSRDMNVPSLTKTDTEPSVLDSGARAQFSSLTKNALNHFFGRVSYNLNKVIDFLSDFLDDFISFTEIVSFSSSATLSNYANGTTKRLLNTAGSTITITLPVGETYLGNNTILLAPSIMLTITKRGTAWINSSGNAATADKWKTARNITISDADGTNTGTAVSVDGSENETLKLPPTIKANLTGKANVRVSLRHGNSFFAKTWAGLPSFQGNSIWTDGDNIYYSYDTTHYVLNKSTSTWVSKTWTGLTSFSGNSIWTDGDNIYYSYDTTQYVLNKSTSTWTAKTWTGLTSFYGFPIWTDGDNIYYSYDTRQYVLDKSTSTWYSKPWTGLTGFYGHFIWTDGDNIYYSDDAAHGVLNKSTSTWYSKPWIGLTSFSGNSIWTDGDNIYYSSNAAHYVLNKSTSTWYSKPWTGLTGFYGYSIWTDGDNIYYSDDAAQYVLPATRHNYVDDNKYNPLLGKITTCKCTTLSDRFVFRNE